MRDSKAIIRDMMTVIDSQVYNRKVGHPTWVPHSLFIEGMRVMDQWYDKSRQEGEHYSWFFDETLASYGINNFMMFGAIIASDNDRASTWPHRTLGLTIKHKAAEWKTYV